MGREEFISVIASLARTYGLKHNYAKRMDVTFNSQHASILWALPQSSILCFFTDIWCITSTLMVGICDICI